MHLVSEKNKFKNRKINLYIYIYTILEMSLRNQHT